MVLILNGKSGSLLLVDRRKESAS